MDKRVLGVANYFIQKSNETGIEVTHSKLQVLCYLSYCKSVCNGNPLFTNNPLAIEYGPMFTDVYNSFKSFKKNVIKEFGYSITGDIDVFEKNDTLEYIWNGYAKKDISTLRDIIMEKHTPWHITWFYYGGKDSLQPFTIPTNLIQTYYKNKTI